MFHAPPFLLILILIHASISHAIPSSEEHRYQAVHQTSNGEQAERHEEASPPFQSHHDEGKDIQERASLNIPSETNSDDSDELFKDISPKELAAVLLQALNAGQQEQTPPPQIEKVSVDDKNIVKEEVDNEEESKLTERVRSRTRSSDDDEPLNENVKIDQDGDMDSVKSLLQELQAFEPPPKREQGSSQNESPESEDLQEIRELLGFGEQTEDDKRSSLNAVPHTPRRLGEEEQEEEKLANAAEDLLLQYLINEEENKSEKEEEGEGDTDKEVDYQDLDQQGSEEEGEENTLEKRSNEDDDEVDPQTIDKLIELSSRLHLPADDVVDIINDVEKRKRRRMKKKKARDDFLMRRIERTRTPSQSWPDSPKSTYYPRRRPEQEASWNKMPATTWKKSSEPTWKNKLSPSTWNKLKGPIWTKSSPRSNWNRVSEPNWKKISDPSWDKPKPSWNKVSDFRSNKVSDSNWNKMPDSGWNKISNFNWNKVPDSNWNKGQDSKWNKVPDSNWNKVPDSNWNKVPDSNWNKVPDSNWNTVPDSNWNKLSDPSWNKASSSNWNKFSDWNKMSEPNWKKVSDPSWSKASEPSWNKVDPNWYKVSESSWNEIEKPSIWDNMPQSSWKKFLEPIPRRYRSRPFPFTSYMRPGSFQPPPRYFYKPPVPPSIDYFDEDPDKQDDMENYIERILLTHPEVFQ
ncbi:uncharacterized protein PAF06_008966 [Gastrophryne carolinensis]